MHDITPSLTVIYYMRDHTKIAVSLIGRCAKLAQCGLVMGCSWKFAIYWCPLPLLPLWQFANLNVPAPGPRVTYIQGSTYHHVVAKAGYGRLL